jgi:hypothetical protein
VLPPPPGCLFTDDVDVGRRYTCCKQWRRASEGLIALLSTDLVLGGVNVFGCQNDVLGMLWSSDSGESGIELLVPSATSLWRLIFCTFFVMGECIKSTGSSLVNPASVHAWCGEAAPAGR